MGWHHVQGRSLNPFIIFQHGFELGFERLRRFYQIALSGLVRRRLIFVPVFLLVCGSAVLLLPWLGQDFFPATDNGQFILHLRAKIGRDSRNDVEVVSGVGPDDAVILDPSDSLVSGTAVQIHQQEPETSK